MFYEMRRAKNELLLRLPKALPWMPFRMSGIFGLGERKRREKEANLRPKKKRINS
jgi:hypothetical protein